MSETDTSAKLPQYIDINGLARLICRSPKTVRNSVYLWADGNADIPRPHRLNGRILFRVDEVRAWMDAGAMTQGGEQ